MLEPMWPWLVDLRSEAAPDLNELNDQKAGRETELIDLPTLLHPIQFATVKTITGGP